MTSQKQIEANRRNAQKSTGPKTEEGKAVSRLNARKHGIFASALTDEDQEELAGLHEELAAWIKPVGPIEAMLVEKLAHTYLRLQRCARAESEYHIRTWEPKGGPLALRQYKNSVDRGEHASWFDRRAFRNSVELFARYDKTLTNPLIKLLHEIERLQRLRCGENVAPPLVGELTLHGEED
jgi:hypothetical protein